jgi:hypothetical protein
MDHAAGARDANDPAVLVKLPQILSSGAGMHRWVWDLHYAAPTSVDPQYPISAVPYRTPRHPLGPRALPGTYTVRLTANGRTVEAPLVVMMDPRIKADLKPMFDLEMRLADMLTRSSVAVLQARAMKATPELTTLLSGAKEETRPRPTQEPPTLESVQSDISTLYEQIDRADATPTAAQVNAVDATAAKFDAVMKQWEALVSKTQKRTTRNP